MNHPNVLFLVLLVAAVVALCTLLKPKQEKRVRFAQSTFDFERLPQPESQNRAHSPVKHECIVPVSASRGIQDSEFIFIEYQPARQEQSIVYNYRNEQPFEQSSYIDYVQRPDSIEFVFTD